MTSATACVAFRGNLDSRVLAEAAIMVALASVLFYFRPYTSPQGGEVTLGSMTPILLLALRRGVKVGVLAGMAFSLVVVTIEPFVYAPAQYLLDYPLAFGALGLAGFLGGPRNEGGSQSSLSRYGFPLAGVLVGISGRFLCHLVSGVIFIGLFVPGFTGDPVPYSAIYNASYLLPELAISATVMAILVRRGVVEVGLREGKPLVP